MTHYTAKDLILSQSANGFSFHPPGSTDEEIASGDADYIVSGPGVPNPDDRDSAFQIWLGMTGQD